MNGAIRILGGMALCCAAGLVAAQPPATPTPQSEAGEPRADTSDSALKGPAAASPAATAASTAATAASTAAPTAATAAPKAATAAAPATSKAAAHRPPGDSATASKSSAKTDRLELSTATVTGDREQPKVMYIVPWKRSDIGDLAGKPMNSLVDEILAPVDRDVFKREVVYYGAVQATPQNGASPKPAQQGEK
jgi:hypothetical protein